jgi:hypothetical protein
MATPQNHKGKGMWFSLFSWMSYETAELVSTVANFFFVVSLVVGVAATIALIGTTSVKEWYWQQDRRESRERIAELDKEAEALKAQAESDRLARLKIEEKLAPRSLTGEQANAIMEAVKPFAPQSFEFIAYQDDEEVQSFSKYLGAILLTAGWKGVPPKGFLAFQLEFGVRVEFSPDKEKELGPAAKALADALTEAGHRASAGVREKLESSDTLKIRVGKKP